jgi:hypothetical protein
VKPADISGLKRREYRKDKINEPQERLRTRTSETCEED